MTALLANAGIAVIKTGGAIITGSVSLLAEAVHSFVDCSNQVILLIGNNAARKAPSETHPLGYGREAFFWSFVVAVLLFSMGGIFAIREGVLELGSNDQLSDSKIGFPILFVAFLMEAYALRTCIAEIRLQKHGDNLWTWFRKTKSSDLLVLLTEDTAAVVGLATAFTCLSLSFITGNPQWDAIGSILVGILLVVVAVFLSIEIKSLIIGEAASPELRAGIERIVSEEMPGSVVLRYIAIQTSSSQVLVSYKVTPGKFEVSKDLIEAINRTEKRARTEFPEIQWQFVEPDYFA